MIRYYCSGFDINNAFGHGLGDMFKTELKATKSIVYVPGGSDKIEKVENKYVPSFTSHFEKVGINFDEIHILKTDTNPEKARKWIDESSFLMLMGGDPFKQKELCEKLEIIENIKNYKGIMMGYSAGAMFMSKHMIIIPCSEEYPDFQIGEGLNFDDLSIYPHNNTSNDEYPDVLDVGGEIYKKNDLLKVANEYGKYYCLQDYAREDGLFDISIIKSNNGSVEYYTENNGIIWEVTDSINLVDINKNLKLK